MPVIIRTGDTSDEQDTGIAHFNLFTSSNESPVHSAIISADMFFFRRLLAVSIAFLRSPARSPSLKPAFLAS